MKCRHFNSHKSFLAYEYVMPRKPTFDHPVRHLRETIGLTQPQFAKMLGVGKDAIQSIENGRRPLSKHLAFKIRRQTGCVLKSNVVRPGHEVFEVRNISMDTLRPYAKQDFESHQEMLREFPKDDLEQIIQAASRCIALLLRTAARRGVARRGAGRVLAICDDFEQFATNCFESYKLASCLKGLLDNEWAEANPDLNVDWTVANFPLAPLATAYQFPIEAIGLKHLPGGLPGATKAEKEPKRSRKTRV